MRSPRPSRNDAVQTAPAGLRFEAKAASMAFFGAWLEAFPDCHVEITRAIHSDDAVVEHGIFSGTRTGVFDTPDGDVPPTGRCVRAEHVNLLSGTTAGSRRAT
jgi:predicted ester cyclase